MRNLRLKEEFLRFIRSYGILGVAIGIVMGQAVSKIINACVEGIIMPVFELVLPGDNKWQDAVFHFGRINIKMGLVIAAFIDFFAIAMALFFFVRYIFRVEDHKK